MSQTWIKVPKETAKLHSLYGVGGWLIVFIIAASLGLVRELGNFAYELRSLGMSLGAALSVSGDVGNFIRMHLLLHVVLVGTILWPLFTRAPEFRTVATVAILASFPLQALVSLIFPVAGIGGQLVLNSITWLTSCAIWIPYLQRSKRVRVTFESSVLDEDPLAATNSVTHQHFAKTYLPRVASVGSASQSPTSVQPTIAVVEADEDAIYVAIARELKTGATEEALWIRLFAENDGDENKTKAAYIRLRALQLRSVGEPERPDFNGVVVAEQLIKPSPTPAHKETNLDVEASVVGPLLKVASLIGVLAFTVIFPWLLLVVVPTLIWFAAQAAKSGVGTGQKRGAASCPGCENAIAADSTVCPHCRTRFIGEYQPRPLVDS